MGRKKITITRIQDERNRQVREREGEGGGEGGVHVHVCLHAYKKGYWDDICIGTCKVHVHALNLHHAHVCKFTMLFPIRTLITLMNEFPCAHVHTCIYRLPSVSGKPAC